MSQTVTIERKVIAEAANLMHNAWCKITDEELAMKMFDMVQRLTDAAKSNQA